MCGIMFLGDDELLPLLHTDIMICLTLYLKQEHIHNSIFTFFSIHFPPADILLQLLASFLHGQMVSAFYARQNQKALNYLYPNELSCMHPYHQSINCHGIQEEHRSENELRCDDKLAISHHLSLQPDYITIWITFSAIKVTLNVPTYLSTTHSHSSSINLQLVVIISTYLMK